MIKDMGCGFQFVTMIREPISRTLSHVAFIWQLWPATKKKYDNIQKMLQLQIYSDHQIQFMYYNIRRCAFDDDQVKECKNVTQETLRKTLKLMENFDVIGILERYNDFVFKILQVTGLEIAENEFSQSIYHRKRNYNKQRITNIDANTLKDIIQTNSYDSMMYYRLSQQ
eukprot:269106_1